jgi:hypothetical protein
MVRRSALVHGYRRSSTCPHVQGEAEVSGLIVAIPDDVRRLCMWAQESDERARTGTPRLREVRKMAAELDRKEAAKRIAWRKRTGRR